MLIRQKSAIAGNPLKAIPADESFILKINNFHNLAKTLVKENNVWFTLTKLAPFRDLTQKIFYLDSLTESEPEISKILVNSVVYISGQYGSGQKSEYLTIINLPAEKSDKAIVEMLSELTSQNVKRNSQNYDGRTIYAIKIAERGAIFDFYITVIEGNIILSKSIVVIEESIRQYNVSGSLADNLEFNKALSTAGKGKDANLFADLRKFPDLSSGIVSDNLSKKVRNYNRFGGWVDFDINPTDGQIILNGFILAGDTKNTFINIFRDCKPVSISVDKILPASTSAFISIGTNNLENLIKGFSRYSFGLRESSERSKQLIDIEKSYNFNPSKLFSSIIDNEISVAQCITNDSTNKPSTFIIVKCKSSNQAQRDLQDAIIKICGKKVIKIQDLQFTYSFDNETRFEITEFPIENITGNLFGGLFNLPGPCYYTFYGNYLLFGHSVEELSYLLYNDVLSKTLSTNEVYKNFKNNLAQQSYLLFYTNLSRSANVFEPYLESKITTAWEHNAGVFQKIQPFGLQITELSDMPYCNILIQYVNEIISKPQTTWESLLDTSFTFKPQFVLNHNNQQNEIFLQDLNNTIYLINKAGRIIWKQKIEEAINSKVYQIDFYKNGKLQILFSTKNYLHLIDREGNYVDRFPVRLRAPASAGMSLFDYENDKNYRIFIPCFDNKVYSYSQDGLIISGWQFKGSDYPIDQPVEHFRIGDKDYIVFGDKYHTYILDRKGDVRVSVNEIITKSKNNGYILDNSGTAEKARILITDTTGKIISIYFDGHISKTDVGTFSANHFFDFKDIDADGINDFVFLDEDKLSVFKQNKDNIISFQFPHIIKERPVYFRFSSSDRKLGFADNEDQKIYLVNNDGSVYKGFPLTGSTLFSIGYLDATDGAFNLIVGGKNNFLYNYSVQ